MLMGLACTAAFAAVQDVTITDANAYAYNASNRLACDSGSKILVKYSYRADGTTMKAALLDFIDVTPPAEGAADPWVSIRVLGAGLTNDVDFSEQPYMWLGTTESAVAVYLNGTFEPYGDVYRLGYSENVTGEYRGLMVTNLTDNPVTGASRSVLAAGTANVLLKGGSFTGGVVAEGPVRLSVTGGDQFGTGYKKSSKPALTLRSVNGKSARLQLKNTSIVYPADLEIRNEGTNDIHSCGASKMVYTTLKGPLTGWGQINLTDQGGLYLTSPSNTFTGVLNDSNWCSSYDVTVCIGDGANCSWAGSQIVQNNLTNHTVMVNCSKDFTLNATLSANGGRLIKKGIGTLTLAKAFARKPIASRPDVPVMQILGGAVKRTQTEPTAANGLVEIAAGATLDLNQVAASSIWLPIGGGSIVNPAGDAVVLKGTTSPSASFYGSVAGSVTVNCSNDSVLPWRLGPTAAFEKGLTVANGTLQANDGFDVPSLELADMTRFEIASHEGLDVVGLKMECWWTGVAWTGSDHSAKMNTAIAYATEHAAEPNFSGDMSAWGETFYSGSGDATGGGSAGAFAKSLGSSRDHFVAKFTGYFIAEETGVYGFRGAADDGVQIILDETNRVVNVAAGTHGTWGTNESVYLAQGRHPITVYFLEESGWEILWVQMKAPGGSWAYIPVSLLSVWDGEHADLGSVTGKGSIGLSASDVSWPAMDLQNFSGRLLANAYTATTNVGTVTPVDSTLYFEGNGSMDVCGTNWWHSGHVAPTVRDGRPAFDCGGVSNSNNYLNRRLPVDLSKPFSVSFDFSIHAPWAGDASLGDGFALMLDSTFTGGYGGTFNYDTRYARIDNSNAYGIQCYLMPDQSHFAWVKNNYTRGAVATNTTYVMKKAKDRTNPFHVTMTWDLEKMVCTFEQTGKATLASTNTYAAADLAEKFPSGQAYLGIWVRTGGYYCTMLFENLSIDEGSTSATVKDVTWNGVLALTNGTVQVVAPTDVSPTLASDLQVVGAGEIDAVPATAVTGGRWSFDLRNPAAKLTLTGALAFSNETPIVVEIVGDATPAPRVLADLTGVDETAADAFRFQLDETTPKSLKLVYSGHKLSIFQNVGTVIFIR